MSECVNRAPLSFIPMRNPAYIEKRLDPLSVVRASLLENPVLALYIGLYGLQHRCVFDSQFLTPGRLGDQSSVASTTGAGRDWIAGLGKSVYLNCTRLDNTN